MARRHLGLGQLLDQYKSEANFRVEGKGGCCYLGVMFFCEEMVASFFFARKVGLL